VQDENGIILKQIKLHTKHNEMLIEMGKNRKKIGSPNVSKQGIVAELIINGYVKEVLNGS